MGLTMTKSIAEWLDFDTEPSSQKAAPTEVTFADDPIALSWASYRVWEKFPARRWTSLNEVTAFPHDREIAQETRRYYRDKLLVQTLKGQPLSEYQVALYSVVSGAAPIMSDQIGLIMKLPYFYVQDTTTDNLCRETKGLARRDLPVSARMDTITPLAKVLHSARRQETYQYWFKNSNNEMTLISVASQNPLRSLVNSIFDKGQPMEVNAVWHYGFLHRHDRLHWNLANVEII